MGALQSIRAEFASALAQDEQIALLHAFGERAPTLTFCELRKILLSPASRGLDTVRVVDLFASLELGKRPGPTSVVRPPPMIRDLHARIACRLTGDLDDGPSLSEVLSRCFEGLAQRAATAKQPTPEQKPKQKQKRSGKRMVRSMLGVLYRTGCRNFEGLSGEILAQLKELCPDLKLGSEAFSDVLKLLHRTGTCLIARPSPRIWQIRLFGLTDPHSARHRRFCEETLEFFEAQESPTTR